MSSLNISSPRSFASSPTVRSVRRAVSPEEQEEFNAFAEEIIALVEADSAAEATEWSQDADQLSDFDQALVADGYPVAVRMSGAAFLAADPSVDVAEVAMSNVLAAQSLAYLRARRERFPLHGKVMALAFGLDGEPELSETQIARFCGITPSYVSQILEAGLSDLREHLGVETDQAAAPEPECAAGEAIAPLRSVA